MAISIRSSRNLFLHQGSLPALAVAVRETGVGWWIRPHTATGAAPTTLSPGPTCRLSIEVMPDLGLSLIFGLILPASAVGAQTGLQPRR